MHGLVGDQYTVRTIVYQLFVTDTKERWSPSAKYFPRLFSISQLLTLTVAHHVFNHVAHRMLTESRGAWI